MTEIPPVKAEVTEHQMIERECPCCGKRTRADAPDGVTAPVQYGPRASALGTYLWHGQFLSRDRACAALGEMFGCSPRPRPRGAQARKIAGLISPAIAAITAALAGADVAHFDETGFRVAGKLAGLHSASAGKFVLVTVHPKRGKDGMDAAGVLPAFTGIACHDAWKPYDSYDGAAGHALRGAHLLRELIAVTETGTEDDVIWAQQAIDALLELTPISTQPIRPSRQPGVLSLSVSPPRSADSGPAGARPSRCCDLPASASLTVQWHSRLQGEAVPGIGRNHDVHDCLSSPLVAAHQLSVSVTAR